MKVLQNELAIALVAISCMEDRRSDGRGMACSSLLRRFPKTVTFGLAASVAFVMAVFILDILEIV